MVSPIGARLVSRVYLFRVVQSHHKTRPCLECISLPGFGTSVGYRLSAGHAVIRKKQVDSYETSDVVLQRSASMAANRRDALRPFN